MNALVIALMEDPQQACTIKSCLHEAGHTVIVVETFLEDRVALLEGHCNLILSDVHLQNGGNVFDFIKWCKREPHLKPIPFVLLSVAPPETAKYLSEGVRVAARMFGAAKYISLSKFEPGSLMAELAEFLPEPKVKPRKL